MRRTLQIAASKAFLLDLRGITYYATYAIDVPSCDRTSGELGQFFGP